MATKTAKTTKVAPKATKKVTTSTGKTKTVPAAKPATKPTPAPKKKCGVGCVIAFVIGAIATIALIGIVIYALAENVKKNDSAMIVEDGSGTKVTTAYVTFHDDSFRLKLPADFKELDAATVDSAEAVYESKDGKTSFVVATEDSAKIANDQVETYLNTMKSVFSAAGTVLKTEYYQQSDHNIGRMQIVLENNGAKYYEDMVFFSQNGQLVLLTFSCEDSERGKWQPVSDYIIKSLEFLK